MSEEVEYPIIIPQSDKPILKGSSKEWQLAYKDLEEQLRDKFMLTPYELDKTQVLRQVMVREDGIGFVFDEGEL